MQSSNKLQVSGLRTIHIVEERAAVVSIIMIIGLSFTQRNSVTNGQWLFSFISARCLIGGPRGAGGGASVPIVLLVFCYIWRV